MQSITYQPEDNNKTTIGQRIDELMVGRKLNKPKKEIEIEVADIEE